MKLKITLAGIGALCILLAIYFFPFGQDFVVLYLTDYFGSQVMAWTALYFICFGLIGAGLLLGGLKVIGFRQISRMFIFAFRNIYVMVATLVIMFVVWLAFSGVTGIW